MPPRPVPRHRPRLVEPPDALLLKGDADPTTRAIMSAALVLDSPPDAARVRAAFERVTRAVPRMCSKVERSSFGLGLTHWVVDDSFDVRDHVREVGAPGDGSLGAVLELAAGSATTPFDSARPLWDAMVVNGVRDDSGDRLGVVLVRVHHAIADGVRVLEMMAHLIDLEADPPPTELPPLEPRGSSLVRRSEHAVHTSSQAARAHQRQAFSAYRLALRTVARPLTSTARAATYARSAVRTFGNAGATPSSLLAARSRARRFGVVELPLDAARDRARAASTTVNDLFLTGLAGGLVRYHEALGQAIGSVPVSFPIDVAGDSGASDGNHFSAAVIAVPGSGVAADERLSAVHELVLSRRHEPALDAPARFAPLLHQVPPRLATAVMHAYSRRVDAQASNIVGPDFPVFLGGSRVRRIHAFGPLPGVPVMAVLVSYDGTCSVGLTIDPAAVVDVELFVRLVQESFDELLA